MRVACARHSYRVMSTHRRVAAATRAALATPPSDSIMALRFASAAEMYPLLPPDAQALIRRFTAHPTVDVLWTSRRWRSRWAVANGWHADREDRLDALVRGGMRTHIEGATIIDDFVSVEVNVEETLLPRTSLERNFKLHLTLGYESDYSAGIARDAVTRINERWRGRDVVLQLRRWTNGGTVELSRYEELALDEDIIWLHSRGYYYERNLHISL